MKFKIGDKAKVIKNGNESFLKHFLEIGDVVEIISEYNGWSKPAYYVKKINHKKYTEPLLEEELEILTN
jgi:hypothetical protein